MRNYSCQAAHAKLASFVFRVFTQITPFSWDIAHLVMVKLWCVLLKLRSRFLAFGLPLQIPVLLQCYISPVILSSPVMTHQHIFICSAMCACSSPAWALIIIGGRTAQACDWYVWKLFQPILTVRFCMTMLWDTWRHCCFVHIWITWPFCDHYFLMFSWV